MENFGKLGLYIFFTFVYAWISVSPGRGQASSHPRPRRIGKAGLDKGDFFRMLLRLGWTTVLFLLLVLASPPAQADTVTVYDFEGFDDLTSLTTQYSGLAFSNTIILTAGISINELEFPPHSGVGVASDDGGPISVSFAVPVLSFGGYFTYALPLTLTGFDALNNQIAAANTAFSSNDGLYGDPGSSPNEFVSIAFAQGISSVTITGSPEGGSFVLDDATLTTESSAVPEPSSFYLLLNLVGGFLLVSFRKRLFCKSL